MNASMPLQSQNFSNKLLSQRVFYDHDGDDDQIQDMCLSLEVDFGDSFFGSLLLFYVSGIRFWNFLST
jgi:hypothetical protein